MSKDWLAWHERYDQPGSRLHHRLEVVRAHIRATFDGQPPGPIRVVSLCAGQGRDLLGVLADHPRRADVSARLVEIDPRNVAAARASAADLGLDAVTVVEGDAARTGAYVGAVPAELVLACGIFGNITDDDIRATIEALPGFCAAGATVIWTRGGGTAKVDDVQRWFEATGFELLAVEVGDGESPYGVGVHRLAIDPQPLRTDRTLFAFRPERQPTTEGAGA